MNERVAIVGVGWSGFRPRTPEVSYKELTYEAAVRAYADAGVDPRADVESFITVAEDFIEGTSIFDEYTPDQIGAALKPVHTITGDGLHGLATAYMLIRTGYCDVVAVEGHSKASNILTLPNIVASAQDPVLNRPLRLNTHFVAGMFIPYQSILIPLVQTLQRVNHAAQALGIPESLNWLVPGYGSIAGLAFVHIVYGIPITTLIFRNYYATIPDELVEAAKIDGANLFGIYRWVLFPISMPAFAVVMIWQFTSIWNEFLFAVILTQNPAIRPVTVALYNLAGSYIVEWNVQMAGALMAALPTLLVYLFLRRFFMRGLLAGSLKG